MTPTNDEANFGVSQGKLRPEELQPDPKFQFPSRTTSFKHVDSEVRKQHQAVSDWLSEAMVSIDGWILELNEIVGQSPEVCNVLLDIKQTILHTQSQIIPSHHLSGPPRPETMYHDIVIGIGTLERKITWFRQSCEAIQLAPKYRISSYWLHARARGKVKRMKDLQAKSRNMARTLELLGASMAMTAAIEQEQLELKSITEALQSSPPAQDQFPQKKANLQRQTQKTTSQPVLPILDQGFDTFNHLTINDSNFARHRYLRTKRLDGTCDWLIKSRTFWHEWFLGGHMTCSTFIYWGAPGVGKSTIASRVIDELARTKRIYAFYYLGDCGMNSVERLVLSLISQVQTLHSEVVTAHTARHSSDSGNRTSTVDEAYGLEEKIYAHVSTNMVLILGPLDNAEISHQASQGTPFSSSVRATHSATLKLLLDYICSAISRIDNTVFVVIDAWERERMEPGSERNFLAVLNRLHTAGCRIFLTSRTTPSSMIHFACISLSVKEPDIRGDIDKFIQVRINDMFMDDWELPGAPNFKVSIDSGPVERFLGSFTLATLFLSRVRAVLSKSKQSILFASINKTSIRASTLSQLLIKPVTMLHHSNPETLIRSDIELFIRGSNAFQIKLILIWLTFAGAPLPFEELELALGQIFTQRQTSEPQSNSSDAGRKEKDLLAILVQLDGLVVWDCGNNLIRLASDEVGEVVKSFWFSTNEQNTTVPSRSETCIIGYICLYYLDYILDFHVDDSCLQSETATKQLVYKRCAMKGYIAARIRRFHACFSSCFIWAATLLSVLHQGSSML